MNSTGPRVTSEEVNDLVRQARLKRDLLTAGAVSFPAAFLASVIAGKMKQFEHRKDEKKISKYVGARNPVLSIDTFSPEEDEEKEAADGLINTPSPLRIPNVVLKPAEKLWDKVTRDDEYPEHLALLAGMVLATGYAGWKLGDAVMDTKEKRRLKAQQKKLLTDLNGLVRKEYSRTRGLKTAAADSKSPADYLNFDFNTKRRTSLSKGVSSAYIAYALLALIASAGTTANLMMKSDRNRAEYKRLLDFEKHQAKAHRAPVLLYAENPKGEDGTVKVKKPESQKSMTIM